MVNSTRRVKRVATYRGVKVCVYLECAYILILKLNGFKVARVPSIFSPQNLIKCIEIMLIVSATLSKMPRAQSHYKLHQLMKNLL